MQKNFETYISSKKAVLESYLDVNYIRFVDDVRPYKRGTVVLEGNIIFPPYPKIGRIFVLKEGLERYFKEPFFIEEKADGYNIRVFNYKGRPFALTRGGFICPFSTDRLLDLYNFRKFFEYYPDYMLCGEIVGPNNPYMELYPPYIKFDIEFRLFDIYDMKRETFLLPEERYKIVEELKIPSVYCYGKFDISKLGSITDLILRLNSEGIEGVVFKSENKPQKYFKYATPQINIKDIEVDIDLLVELPAEFFIQRILRYVISSQELNYPVEKDLERVSNAFILGFKRVLEEFKQKGKVSRDYVLFFNNPDNITEFLKLERRASNLIKVHLKNIEKDGQKYKVTIEKTFLKATSRISRLLKGYPIYD
ncbi:MAG: RNA ligase [candidate division WOR-3 bacterium]